MVYRNYTVDVDAHGTEYERFVEPAIEAVTRALALEDAPEGAEVLIVLASDEEIAEYHERFMDLPGPTDVLSWPSDTEGMELGDVMVSCDTARAQAQELGHSWEREVCVLAVHGTLHLMGWNDLTPGDREAMQRRVDEIVDQS